MAKLNVNGKPLDVKVDDDTPLLWVLREQLGMTGTKYGCGVAQCGACSGHLNGEVQRSCAIPVGSLQATDKIVTIEGLSPDGSHPAQKAWVAHQVPQCGYCQPGILMTVAGAMKAGHRGSEIASEVKNLCVCGTYQRIREALVDL